MELSSVPDEAVIEPRSQAEFSMWVTTSVPGDKLVYHRGYLMRDRVARNRYSQVERRALSYVANSALRAQQAGLVHLVQKRIGNCCWDYIAVRR